jgi:hypothetical protein
MRTKKWTRRKWAHVSLLRSERKAKRTLDPCARTRTTDTRMQSAGVHSITRVGIVRTYSCIFGQLTFVRIRIQCALSLRIKRGDATNFDRRTTEAESLK